MSLFKRFDYTKYSKDKLIEALGYATNNTKIGFFRKRQKWEVIDAINQKGRFTKHLVKQYLKGKVEEKWKVF